MQSAVGMEKRERKTTISKERTSSGLSASVKANLVESAAELGEQIPEEESWLSFAKWRQAPGSTWKKRRELGFWPQRQCEGLEVEEETVVEPRAWTPTEDGRIFLPPPSKRNVPNETRNGIDQRRGTQMDEEEGSSRATAFNESRADHRRVETPVATTERDASHKFSCGGNAYCVIAALALCILASAALVSGLIFGPAPSKAQGSDSSTIAAAPPEWDPRPPSNTTTRSTSSPASLSTPSSTVEKSEVKYCEGSQLHVDDRSNKYGFGTSVATSGDTVVVGATKFDSNGTKVKSGSAFVFVKSDSFWNQQAMLLPHDGADDDRFGSSVGIYGDTAVVGAWGTNNDQGSAYVFVREGSVWSQQAKLLPGKRSDKARFGWSAGIFADSVVVGERDTYGGKGRAYVFTRSGLSWMLQASLEPTAPSYGEVKFGYSVAINRNTVIVGAQRDDIDRDREDSGSAYVFVRSGLQWTLQAKLFADDASAGASFGYSVSLLDNTAIIGTWGDSSIGEESGSAYIFARTGRNAWTQLSKLLPAGGKPFDHFGRSVAISKQAAFVGADLVDDKGEDSGSLFVFARRGDAWTQLAKLLPSGRIGDRCGWSVAAANETVVTGCESGESAYTFELCQ